VPDSIDRLSRFLAESLDDARLSRGERTDLRQLLGDLRPSFDQQGVLLHEAFRLARSRLVDPRDGETLDWLYEVVKVLRPTKGLRPSGSRLAEVHFMPGEEGVQRLVQLIERCRIGLDVCVFTVTDDRISRALLEAYRRGISMRVLTDDDKALDRGSDIPLLRRMGIPLRTDDSPAHMHHKFALFDRAKLLTGSYNWTRSATSENQENFLVTDDPTLVGRYQVEFDRLWEQFDPGAELSTSGPQPGT